MAPIKKAKISSVGEEVKERETLNTTCGVVNLYICYGKQYGSSSKKLKSELLYDLAMGVYLKKNC